MGAVTDSVVVSMQSSREVSGDDSLVEEICGGGGGSMAAELLSSMREVGGVT